MHAAGSMRCRAQKMRARSKCRRRWSVRRVCVGARTSVGLVSEWAEWVGYGRVPKSACMLVAGLGIGLGPASLSAAVVGGGTEWATGSLRQPSWPAANAHGVSANVSAPRCFCVPARAVYETSSALRKSTARAIYKMGMQTLSIMNSFLIACVEARETVRDV